MALRGHTEEGRGLFNGEIQKLSMLQWDRFKHLPPARVFRWPRGVGGLPDRRGSGLPALAPVPGQRGSLGPIPGAGQRRLRWGVLARAPGSGPGSASSEPGQDLVYWATPPDWATPPASVPRKAARSAPEGF